MRRKSRWIAVGLVVAMSTAMLSSAAMAEEQSDPAEAASDMEAVEAEGSGEIFDEAAEVEAGVISDDTFEEEAAQEAEETAEENAEPAGAPEETAAEAEEISAEAEESPEEAEEKPAEAEEAWAAEEEIEEVPEPAAEDYQPEEAEAEEEGAAEASEEGEPAWEEAEAVETEAEETGKKSGKKDKEEKSAAEEEETPAENNAHTEEYVTVPYESDDEEMMWEQIAVPNSYYVESAINIRSAASEDSEILGFLYNGAAAWVLDKGEEWTTIYSNGITGYVKNELMLYGGDVAEVADYYCVKGVRADWDGVIIYENSDGITEKDVMNSGDAYPVVEEEEDHWVEIQYDEDTTAFVSADDVTFVMLFESATPIVQAAEAAEPEAAEPEAEVVISNATVVFDVELISDMEDEAAETEAASAVEEEEFYEPEGELYEPAEEAEALAEAEIIYEVSEEESPEEEIEEEEIYEAEEAPVPEEEAEDTFEAGEDFAEEEFYEEQAEPAEEAGAEESASAESTENIEYEETYEQVPDSSEEEIYYEEENDAEEEYAENAVQEDTYEDVSGMEIYEVSVDSADTYIAYEEVSYDSGESYDYDDIYEAADTSYDDASDGSEAYADVYDDASYDSEAYEDEYDDAFYDSEAYEDEYDDASYDSEIYEDLFYEEDSYDEEEDYGESDIYTENDMSGYYEPSEADASESYDEAEEPGVVSSSSYNGSAYYDADTDTYYDEYGNAVSSYDYDYEYDDEVYDDYDYEDDDDDEYEDDYDYYFEEDETGNTADYSESTGISASVKESSETDEALESTKESVTEVLTYEDEEEEAGVVSSSSYNGGAYYDANTDTYYDEYGEAVSVYSYLSDDDEEEFSFDDEEVEEAAAEDEYDEELTSLIASLIYCEAQDQPYDGMVAVGAVVMNRVSDEDFPDTVDDVIYENGQFTPASSGALSSALEDGVDDIYYTAAEDALSGTDPTDGALYFNTSQGSGDQIGDHWFY